LGEQDKIKQALEMGADDYLIKASLTPSELVEIIQDKM
jgi:DNA-binding response OmpR family regulator